MNYKTSIIGSFFVVTSFSAHASELALKPDYFTHAKSALMVGTPSSFQLCDAQSGEALTSPDSSLFPTLTSSTKTSSLDELHQLFADLQPVRTEESTAEKALRLKNEDALQDLLSDADILNQFHEPGADGNNGNDHLQQKGYQLVDGKLVNRYTVYKQRYPQAFGTFLSRTNEKEISLATISSFMEKLHKVHPSYFDRGLQIFDIGFGNGKFSQSLVHSFGKILPSGAKNITFSGMDTQEPFAHATQQLISELGVPKVITTVGNFKDENVPKTAINSANLVIASHFAYVFSDMDQFVEKVESIMQKDGIAILLHDRNTAIDTWRQKFSTVLRNTLIENAPAKIQKSLDKAGLYSCSYEFQPTLTFPQLNSRDWKALQTVETHNFKADYSHWNANRREAKQLLEFFLQDPLEAFTQEQRHRLVNEFRNLLVSNDYKIPLANSMQIVAARDSKQALKLALKKAMKKRF